MEEQQVAALLISDVQTHFAWFQVAVLFVVLVLIIISMVLAIRAYAVLSEARILYARASAAGAERASQSPGRIATAAAINAAMRGRKVRLGRGRTLP